MRPSAGAVRLGVADRHGRDVHAADDPGACNQGTDDGLDVVVQPDGGQGGSHPSTLTGSAHQRQPATWPGASQVPEPAGQTGGIQRGRMTAFVIERRRVVSVIVAAPGTFGPTGAGPVWLMLADMWRFFLLSARPGNARTDEPVMGRRAEFAACGEWRYRRTYLC